MDRSAVPVELASTPFFPQLMHQCGPAALATILVHSGVSTTPEELAPLVYLPGRKGSLQIEMRAAPRRYGRLGVELQPELDAITRELDAGRPVLVLHNYGFSFWPRWHYAVVVGHDPVRQKVVLRSGATRRQELSARTFMRAWDNAGRWAIVLLRPGELTAGADSSGYLEEAIAFERMASPELALRAFEAATQAWPEAPMGWVGRGTALYRRGDRIGAIHSYSRALALDPSIAGARNNLAMTLLEEGCPQMAFHELRKIDVTSLSAGLRPAVEDTRSQIEARQDAADGPGCRALVGVEPAR